MKIKNMRIYLKYYLTIGVVFALLLVALGVYKRALHSTKNRFETVLKVNVAVERYALRIRKYISLCRNNEKDYLVTGEEKYFVNIKDSLKFLEQTVEAMIPPLTVGKHTDLVAKLNVLLKDIASYISTLDVLQSEKLVMMGSVNSAAYREVSIAAENLEKSVIKIKSLKHIILQLRQQEKNYLLTKDAKHKLAVDALLTTIEASLASRRVKKSALVEIKVGLNEYRNSFEKLYNSMTKFTALTGSIETLFNKITPMVAEIENYMLSETAETFQNAGREARKSETLAKLIGLASLLLGLIILFYLARVKISVLAESKSSLKRLEKFPMAFLEIDCNYNITSVNEVAAKFADLGVDACIGQKCYDVFKFHDCNTEECASLKAMRGMRHVTKNSYRESRRSDGDSVPIRYSSLPIVENGDVSGAIELFVDIPAIGTEIVNSGIRPESGKHVSSEVKIPCVEVDSKLNVVSFNKALADQFIMDGGLAEGVNFFEFIKSIGCKNEVELEGGLIIDEKPKEFEISISATSGELPVRVISYPNISNSGEVTGASIYFVDQSGTYKILKGIRTAITSMKDLKNKLVEASNSLSIEGASSAKTDTESLEQLLKDIKGNASSASGSVTSLINDSTSIAKDLEDVSSVVGDLDELFTKESSLTESAAKIADKASKQTNEVSEAMASLTGMSENIKKVVQMISDIARQTNMLALNAAIEAVSAGEAGKGFAIVASEVKTLAKQTAESTEEISTQMEEIRSATKTADEKNKVVMDIICELRDKNKEVAVVAGEQSMTAQKMFATVANISLLSGSINESTEIANSGVSSLIDEADKISNALGGLGSNKSSQSELENNLKIDGSKTLKKQIECFETEIDSLEHRLGAFELYDKLD